MCVRNKCSMEVVNTSDQYQLDNDFQKEETCEAGVKSSSLQKLKLTQTAFHGLTAHSVSTHFHATIPMCGAFVRLKALQRNMQCLHVNRSHTGSVTSLIFCIKLWRSSCQLQISPLYPADKRQSNKVYNCEVKH